jgi:DNA polymerase-1
MSESLNIPVEDAENFIKNFYETFPKIKIYYDNYLKNAKIHDLVETILGRRRYVFEDPKRRFIDNGMRRVLMNYPIQGSAADLMKKAMIEVEKEVLQNHDDIHLLLQIHDDLVFEIKNENKEILTERVEQIKKIMCNVYPLSVPMDVEVKIGENWGEMTSFQHK